MGLTSVLIPARNEEKNIAKTIDQILDQFKSEALEVEVLVVDDGSTDNTVKVVQEYVDQDKRVRLIVNKPPHGIGNALKMGLDFFEGDKVIITMADGSDEPAQMITYARKVDGGFDCCFGNRWGKEATVTNYPWHKLLLNRCVNFWIALMFGVHYYDTTNAFKCYSRRVIDGIKPVLSHHFNITVELPIKAIVRGYSYKIIPTNWHQREFGFSSLKIKEMGSRYLFIILYLFFEKILCKADYKKKPQDITE